MDQGTEKSPFYRLVALWAFSEAFLGGMLHGFHLPVTGLVLGSFAVVCLSAIASQTSGKGRFLKATVLVILVKAILSPHSPPTAYLAVFLQGLFAELIFGLPLPYRVQTILLGILSLVESAFQRLIVLTVLFGNDFWTAVDGFTESVVKSIGFGSFSGSLYLVSAYVFIHFGTGVFAGYYSSKLPDWLKNQTFAPLPEVNLQNQAYFKTSSSRTKRPFSSPLSFLLFGLLVLGLMEAYSTQSWLITGTNKPLRLLIRSALVLSVWYFYLAPILLKWFRNWVEKKKKKRWQEIEKVLNLLPEMHEIMLTSWQQAKLSPLANRIPAFVKTSFYLC
ncbi:MAG TPA: hypothetical protein PKY12_11565, partial [Catalimonadaceae bacterium]|nr:hypothetical protein [Catalimonadaceae bacterium]